MNQTHIPTITTMPPLPSTRININSEADIIYARKHVRDISTKLGFSLTEVTRMVTAASELSRNIQRYAKTGWMLWSVEEHHSPPYLELRFVDQGPGIENIEQAMTAGFSTARSLGMGLPGAKRLMDEMQVHSSSEEGTTVIIRKYLPRPQK